MAFLKVSAEVTCDPNCKVDLRINDMVNIVEQPVKLVVTGDDDNTAVVLLSHKEIDGLLRRLEALKFHMAVTKSRLEQNR